MIWRRDNRAALQAGANRLIAPRHEVWGQGMALASLIIGCALAEDDVTPRAALPLLGASLVEYQARQAAAAGAGHIVILVERIPAALVGAVDRLKRDGIAAELARTVADAADRIHPEERLLLIGDGVVAARDLVERTARLSSHALLTVPDSATAYERIDANARWAGLALTDGALLRRTATMLGDWDLQSTLLRRLVQGGATRVDAGASAIRLVSDTADARGAETALIGGGTVGRHATAALLDRNIRPLTVRAAALALAVAGAAAVFGGWVALGAAALALAGPLDLLPTRMNAAALRAGARDAWRSARALVILLAVLALAWRMDTAGAGWGVWPLAAGAVALAALLLDQGRRTGLAIPDSSWLALPLLAGTLVDRPVAGLAAVTVMLLAALFHAQRSLARP